MPFLHNLARYGNASIACQLALVDQSYVYRQRRLDPAFAAEWAAAKAQAAVKLRQEGGSLPPPGRQSLEGMKLELSGIKGGRMRIQRARPGGWTRKDEIIFLNRYAATGNVEEACRAAGHRNSSAYNRRKYCPRFVAEWAIAKAMAKDGLPFRLIETVKMRINNTMTPDQIVPDDVPIISVQECLDTIAGLYHIAPKWRDNYGPGWT